MKKLMLFLAFSVIFASCSSNDDGPKEDILSEEVTLSNSETFQYSLGYFGFEEGASVQKEPEHYELSEVVRDLTGRELIYRYKAQENFTGKDYVEIWTGRGSDGASPSTRIEIIKISFNITD